MSTIRRGALPSDHFTIISNAWLRDERLPWAARGLLAWMASHTDGYDITEDAIVAAGPSGRAAVKVMILALQEAGYLRRERTSLITGGSTVDYILTDPESDFRTLPRVRKSDPRADQGEQAPEDENPQVSPNVGKSNPRSLLEEQEKTNEKTSSFREVVVGEIVSDDGALFSAPVGAALEVAQSPNAGQLTRRWIDYCAEKDVKLTTSVIKRYGASVRQALADGFADALIRRALAAMLADRVASRPALFDSYLIRVQQGPEMPPARLTAHQADAERRAAEAGTTAAARLYDTLTRDA